MPCCPVLLSLYCICYCFLNEINGDGDGDFQYYKLYHSAYRVQYCYVAGYLAHSLLRQSERALLRI